MATNKNIPSPGKKKMYYEHNYRLPSATAGSQYDCSGNHNSPPIGNLARQKNIPISDESLDHLIQTPANNEFYQHAPETLGKRITRGINPDELVYSGHVTHPARREKTCPASLYELSQPIWFYMIMKKLAAEKEKKK